MIKISELRSDFPILSQKFNSKPLVYFDNAATTQKPKAVIERIVKYYSEENANVHRGVYKLSTIATDCYENSREVIREFINAQKTCEIIFTRGTTESINLVATSLYFSGILQENDEIIISEMEHHANIVPWQICCKNLKIKVLPFDGNGILQVEKLESLISTKTKLIAVTNASNTFGIINPIEQIIQIAKKHNILTLVDGAQIVPHHKVDMQKLDSDFFVFSGHKIYAPTGIGILYGKEEILNQMQPYHGGGEMIDKVTFEKTTFNSLPHKFEAGTPNISGAIALAEAIKYLEENHFPKLIEYEENLTKYLQNRLSEIDDIVIYGNSLDKLPVFSFNIKGIHHYDLGTLLDSQGIAVRTGNHCTQTIMQHFGIPGTLRVSLSFYNTTQEIDFFIKKLKTDIELLRG